MGVFALARVKSCAFILLSLSIACMSDAAELNTFSAKTKNSFNTDDPYWAPPDWAPPEKKTLESNDEFSQILAAPLSFSTPYNSNNGQRGAMFDIYAENEVTICNIDANIYFGTTSDYEIYYRAGSHIGFDSNATAWTLLGSAQNVTSLGLDVPTPLPIPFSVNIPAGQTYSFYVTNTIGGGLHYTEGTAVGNIWASNTDLTLYEGIGKSYPFGLNYVVRNFNGTFHYALGNDPTHCDVDTFTVGGNVSGLNGSITLQNNAADDIVLNADGSFTFPAQNDGTGYNVTISSSPATQSCSVNNGSGTLAGGNVTNVSVTCSTNTFTVGGNVSGLNGSITLQNNAADDIVLNADGSFTFPAQNDGTGYNVTISSSPATQSCFVNNGSGTLAGSNVTNVSVTCSTNTFTVGGNVSGLNGSITLQNNAADDIVLNADGIFTFPAQNDGTGYNVTISSSPATQSCNVNNGSGTLAGSNVTNVSVTCSTNTFTVGGNVSGLNGSITLQNNAADDIVLNADGIFTFPAQNDGTGYNVTISSSPATQSCSVNNGSGTLAGSNVTNVSVTCSTNTFTVGGNVSGLNGSITLQNNAADDIVLNADGSFTFPAQNDGTGYNVTISNSPATQSCSVNNGSGTLAGSNVTNVSVTCSTNTFTVGGNVSGLNGSITLQNNAADDIVLNADGSFTFPAQNDGTGYNVTISSSPSTQSCSVNNGSGTLAGSNVTNVSVTCSTNTFTVGGNVSGLNGSITLQNNAADDIVLNADGSFTFPAQNDGTGYNVTISSSPATQSCSVNNGSGTLAGSIVTNVSVTCSTNTFTVGGNVSGLNGSITLQNNAADDIVLNADGIFTFPAQNDGTGYNVTISSSPVTQTCTVSNGSGTVAGSDITDISVTCSTDTYIVSGNVTGLNGSITLQNNGTNDIILNADGGFSFPAQADGSGYNVTVSSSPTTQTCLVNNGSGTLSGSDINNIAVSCNTDTYTVGGNVSGLNGSITLQNNGLNDIVLNTDGSFTFPAQNDGTGYNVTISSSPATQSCSVNNGSGTLAGSNVTNVSVTCSTNTFTVGGNVSGLNGSITLQNNGLNDIVLNTDGSFTFPSQDDGTGYNVTISNSPATQSCTVNNNSGTLTGTDINNVAVTCSTDTYSIGGTVSGLNGSITLQNNGSDDLVINANGPFTFGTELADLSAYEVTLLSQSTNPPQTCAIDNATGNLSGAHVTNVSVECITEHPDITLSMTQVTFSSTHVGQNQTATVTVTNTGSADLNISAITSPAQPFSISGGSCSLLPLILAPNESCQLEVSFNPNEAGAFSAQISISSNALSSPDNLILTGSGTIINAVTPVPTLSAWGLVILIVTILGLMFFIRTRPTL